MDSFVSHLFCPRCGERHDPSEPHNVCTCGSPLVVEYDLDRVGAAVHREDLAGRDPTMWRYRGLLPAPGGGGGGSLGGGFTPPPPAPPLGSPPGLSRPWGKED